MLEKLQSGILGLDEVLNGGYLPNRAYLVRGQPGTGKTTVGLHFLTAGATAGESSLFITLEEPVAQLQTAAQGLYQILEIMIQIGGESQLTRRKRCPGSVES